MLEARLGECVRQGREDVLGKAGQINKARPGR
jgi:hypothetical protein